MTTTIRPEVSVNNNYFIEKHRYYELKHFCLQYNDWKHSYKEVTIIRSNAIQSCCKNTNNHEDIVFKCTEKRLYFTDRMRMIEKTARATDPIIGPYIFKGVTTGSSYDTMNAVQTIPCCRDRYYELYRKFFWLLDKTRK